MIITKSTLERKLTEQQELIDDVEQQLTKHTINIIHMNPTTNKRFTTSEYDWNYGGSADREEGKRDALQELIDECDTARTKH